MYASSSIKKPVIVTIVDAIEQEKQHLMIICETCRVTRQVPWRHLPALRLGDRIDELLGRLRCRKCGRRPTKVYASAQRDASGYVTKAY